MAYTETTTIGYGSRVGNSFRSIGTGFLLFIAGTTLLWWNEGRVVKTDKMLNEAEGVTVELETIDRINPEMDGKLVYATGFANTEDSLVDAQFDIGATAIRLVRDVEYYQWVEHSQEQHKDKLGGSEEIVTTYTYTKEWTSEPVQSSRFHDPAYQQKNFVLTTADSESWQAEKVSFGAFLLNEHQICSIRGDEPVSLSLDSLTLDGWNKEVRQVLGRHGGNGVDAAQLVHVNNNQLYYGISPSSPAVGDVRITWTKVLPAKVTIIAVDTPLCRCLAGHHRPEGNLRHPGNAAEGHSLRCQHHRLGRRPGVHGSRPGVVAHHHRLGLAVLQAAHRHRHPCRRRPAHLVLCLQGKGKTEADDGPK